MNLEFIILGIKDAHFCGKLISVNHSRESEPVAIACDSLQRDGPELPGIKP
jgi:hypothetical protein